MKRRAVPQYVYSIAILSPAICFASRASADVLYGVTNTDPTGLYTINPSTGKATGIGSQSYGTMTDLTSITFQSAPITWNNSGASGPSDGKTWDIGTNNNWTNGYFSMPYADGSNVAFNDNNAGNYAVTLNTTVSPGSVTFNNSDGNYTISGSGTIAGTGGLSKSGTGTVTLSTFATYTGGTTVSAGVLQINPTSVASTTISALANGPLSISGSGEVALSTNVTLGSQSGPIPASNINLTSLSISGNGTLDIGNNDIIIDYSAGSDPIFAIKSWIMSGYAGGSWTGTGITSSAAAAHPSSYGIGYADSADLGNPAGLASGQIELKYTLLGDANLEGVVNGSDFSILAANFGSGATNWDQGNFLFTSSVNGSDFSALAANFGQGDSGTSVSVSSADVAALDAFAKANGLMGDVPEPGMIGALVMAPVLLGRRRFRGRSERL
jgi:autotransporter-associated beta strand protein